MSTSTALAKIKSEGSTWVPGRKKAINLWIAFLRFFDESWEVGSET